MLTENRKGGVVSNPFYEAITLISKLDKDITIKQPNKLHEYA